MQTNFPAFGTAATLSPIAIAITKAKPYEWMWHLNLNTPRTWGSSNFTSVFD